MSTEVPSPRKLNVEPATAEELRAKYNTNTNDTDTEEEQLAKYNEQLAQEEQASLTRGQQMRRLLTIGGATLGVGVTAMVGANLMGNATTEKGPGSQPETTSSADATPGANETTAPTASAEPSSYASPANTIPLETAKPFEPSDPSLRHESVVKHDLYNTLKPEVKAKIDTIANLTPEQATALPLEDQLLFASFVRDNNEAHTRWRMETNGTAPFKKLLDTAKPATATDTGDEVLAQGNMNAQIMTTLMPKGKTLDQTTAQKLTILNISPESKGYENFNDHLQSFTGGLLQPDVLSVLAEKSFAKDGVQYMVLNLPDKSGGVNQSTLRLQSYIDYNGIPRATWQTILAVSSDDPRFDTSLSK